MSARNGHGRSHHVGLVPRLLAGMALVAMLASACSDDDSDALSKEDYIEQANAICQATNDEIDPVVEAFFEDTFADVPDDTPPGAVPGVITAFDELFDEVLTPAVDQQMEELRALAPPEADAELLDEVYDDVEAGLDAVNATLDEAVAGDEAAMEAFSSGASEEQLSDANRRAREYGMTVCGAED